jgi:hypothetical protein
MNSAASNYVGNYVCVNGANSGEHCAVAKGDSGGPVISQSTGGAFGYGTVWKVQDEVSTCGYGPAGKLDGYHKVWFKGLKFALDHFDATLGTSPSY